MSKKSMCKKNAVSQQGFTLIELMVALGVFAVIGLGSWKLLQQLIQTQESLTHSANQLASLQKGLWIIERDLGNLVPRSVRIEYSQSEAAVTSLSSAYHLSFSRSGWPNPTQQSRSNLQRVAYRVGDLPGNILNNLAEDHNDGPHLIREFWPVLDRNRETPKYSQILIANVDDLQISFIDQQAIPRSYWPLSANAEDQMALPRAIHLTLNTQSHGELNKLYVIEGLR